MNIWLGLWGDKEEVTDIQHNFKIKSILSELVARDQTSEPLFELTNTSTIKNDTEHSINK
jgi:hypothetical protein